MQSGGIQNVSGIADNANVGDGGRQIVKDGGKTSGTVLQNNSMQDIDAGGHADGSIIYAGVINIFLKAESLRILWLKAEG
ncbi:hypothetical protein CEW81_14050 [Kluyvera genomosp. 3]|uniref:Uncharacterized protein n=1 Tax=Kluyvera genomosp. 3 TaxID=2774055 RepID=A0A248KL78_9ENTR|nr:hypothetical protein CEW81_14050 [Kluyvera genomosp. 3]